MMDVEGKRISLKRKNPNPIFQEWLLELHNEAKIKKSKLEPMLQEALNSLSKYPLPLQSGADCAILKGFDKNLCSFLDERLEVYNYNIQHNLVPSNLEQKENIVSPNTCQDNSDTALVASSSKTQSNSNLSSQDNVGVANLISPTTSCSSTSSKKSKGRKYKPAYRSGGYAILLALLEHYKENLSNPGILKQEVIDRAQPHSEESFIRPKPESFYTAWSNMSTLQKKGLVHSIRSKKSVYKLSEDGIALAIELLEESTNVLTTNDIIFHGASTSCNSQETESVGETQAKEAQVVKYNMPGNSFDVILLIDVNETTGLKKKNEPTVAQFKKYTDLKHEYRSLKIGDFTWIARHKEKKELEFVLPYIVERKRMDDLGSSIKDGRFHEQKFRLKKCGVKNIMYLIEDFGANKHCGLPVNSLMQAIANTRVQDGFKVHKVKSATEACRFLAIMTKRLTIQYQDKLLTGSNTDPKDEVLMTFDYFNKASIKSKPLTVTETFIKILLQLKGVSVDKALAITKAYSTPRALMSKYDECSSKEGEMLLSKLKHSELNRKVGSSASKAIYQLFKD